jgi:hypothetical protein
MEAMPEKFYYVPFPRLPHLRMSVFPRLPLLPTRGIGLSSKIGEGRRRWRRRRRVLETWWASHTLDAVLWTLAIVSAVLVGFVLAQV